MIRIEGKTGIKSAVICDSVSEAGIRLTTFEIEYPRLILAEINTHQMLAKNSASSRAIPFAKMQGQLTAAPARFGKNVSGMQDSGEHAEVINGSYTPVEWWNLAKLSAVQFSKGFADAGYHKQVFNRLTEPFQMMKTVMTGTEWDNFFWLRDEEAADPSLHELAHYMSEAKNASSPQPLKSGEWHLPYVNTRNDKFHCLEYFIDGGILTLDEAIKVSAARCAAVSFRNEDYTLDKCLEVYDRLVGAERKHASAFGHQATPISEMELDVPSKGDEWMYTYVLNAASDPETWEAGISHVDRDGQLWSAMLRGWIQYRKLIPGENYIKEDV